MAAPKDLPSEDQFPCSICLAAFTDPVTTSCGHNFYKNCITEHWNTNDQYLCLMCKKVFNTRPELHVNSLLSEMVAQSRQAAQQTASSSSSTEQQASKSGEIPCDVCTGTKLKALKSCGVSGLKRHQLINPVDNLEGRMCTKLDTFLEVFCKTDQACVCMLCTVSDHKAHEVVPLKDASEEKKTEPGKTQAEIQQMIEMRRLKIQDVKHSHTYPISLATQ